MLSTRFCSAVINQHVITNQNYVAMLFSYNHTDIKPDIMVIMVILIIMFIMIMVVILIIMVIVIIIILVATKRPFA